MIGEVLGVCAVCVWGEREAEMKVKGSSVAKQFCIKDGGGGACCCSVDGGLDWTGL